MNSIAALAKPFCWKLARYPKFNRKTKRKDKQKEVETAEKEDIEFQQDDSQLERTSQSFRWDFSTACLTSEESDSIEGGQPKLDSPLDQIEEEPLYENADCLPLYQNVPSSLFSCGSTVSEESEHIYDYISHSSLCYSPVNVFLSLIDGETTISPDPNIYEVPPGAILNSSYFPEEIPRNITPPIEFKDKLTWERIHSFKEFYSDKSTEAIYSQVIKPKRVKYRPGLENIIKMKEQEENEIVVDGTEKENMLIVLPENAQNEENVDVIDISEDSCWTSEEKKTDLEIDQTKECKIRQLNCVSSVTDRTSEQTYTNCIIATVKPLTYEENYDNIHTECKNIGAQIMQKYEEDIQKLKESKNLPDVSLLDVDESIENIEKERRRIIENQAVRAKRITSWIKGFSGCGDDIDFCNLQDTNIDSIQDDVDLFDSAEAAHYFAVAELAELTPDGEIVYDSILQNKERTKNYWERLMLATESAGGRKRGAAPAPGESVVEREIRAQREREEAVAREREAAARLAAAGVGHQREDQSGARLSSGPPKEDDAGARLASGPPKEDDAGSRLVSGPPKEDEAGARLTDVASGQPREDEAALASMPTTDEGNYSEYGSEEKEHSIDGNTSRVVTPEVGFSHQRSPSFESMSSGHSSGSEFGIRHRNITIRSIDHLKDNDIFIRSQKETPIEKEIRLAKEREEELKRDKRNSLNLMTMNANKGAGDKEEQQNCLIPQPAKRIQKEMAVEVDMEKESKTPTKDVSVQTKENENEENQSTSLNKCVSMTNLLVQRDALDTPSPKMNGINGTVRNSPSWTPTNVSATPKLFIPNRGQKGMMKRFLESRGKLGPTFTFNSNASLNSPVSPKSPETNEIKKIFIDRNPDEKQEGITVVTRRPKYISAEDKIQMELEEMKKREAELRKERARHLGRSQPNLQEIDTESEEDEEVRLPTMGKLRTALSNPNLLDTKPVIQKVVPNKRRSALIDEWENRIRKEQ